MTPAPVNKLDKLDFDPALAFTAVRPKLPATGIELKNAPIVKFFYKHPKLMLVRNEINYIYIRYTIMIYIRK